MCLCMLFFNDTATTEIDPYCHTRSLHDALPISRGCGAGLPLVESDARRPCRDGQQGTEQPRSAAQSCELVLSRRHRTGCVGGGRLSGRRLERSASVVWSFGPTRRSEEHTSELQSLMRISYAVFCLKTKTLQ